LAKPWQRSRDFEMALAARRNALQSAAPPAVWAGVECTRVRVGRRIVDQLDLTGHRERDADIDAIASLGVSAVRYPVLWEHVAPTGLKNADWSWHDKRLGMLRDAGVKPIVGLLHHGSGPRGMSLADGRFPKALAHYATAVLERYPWIDTFLPINEPLTTARFGGLYGWWQPHDTSLERCVTLLLNQCLAIRAVGRALKDLNPEVRIIVNEDVARTFSTPSLQPLADHMNQRRWLSWDALTGKIDATHALYPIVAATPENARMAADLAADPFVPDILGVDHYVTSDRYLDDRVDHYIPERRSEPSPGFVDVEASRVRGVPTGSVARALSDTWQRYGLPMALTEISLAGEPGDQVAWWSEAYAAAAAARDGGMDVRAVTAWAVFGAVDWHVLMRKREDMYEPGVYDVSSGRPVARPVAEVIRFAAERAKRWNISQRATSRKLVIKQASNGVPGYVTSDASGWWARDDRYTLTIPRATPAETMTELPDASRPAPTPVTTNTASQPTDSI
jgi:dTDP-4-dehydrorhamnose reductase